MTTTSPIDPLQPERLLTTSDVLRLIPISRVQLWKLRHAGAFPAAVRISENRIGWKVSSIQAWINSRPGA